MSRIVVKTFQLHTSCSCDLRVEQWDDQRKKEHGIMVVGKPCEAVVCDGRKQAATVKKWLVARGGVQTIDGQMIH